MQIISPLWESQVSIISLQKKKKNTTKVPRSGNLVQHRYHQYSLTRTLLQPIRQKEIVLSLIIYLLENPNFPVYLRWHDGRITLWLPIFDTFLYHIHQLNCPFRNHNQKSNFNRATCSISQCTYPPIAAVSIPIPAHSVFQIFDIFLHLQLFLQPFQDIFLHLRLFLLHLVRLFLNRFQLFRLCTYPPIVSKNIITWYA